jgi:hypothetical protein
MEGRKGFSSGIVNSWGDRGLLSDIPCPGSWQAHAETMVMHDETATIRMNWVISISYNGRLATEHMSALRRRQGATLSSSAVRGSAYSALGPFD